MRKILPILLIMVLLSAAVPIGNPLLIEQFRITSEEVGEIGHWSMGGYLIRESDALILTRVALGWGAPTSIQMEALCVGGCQYDIVRVIENVIYPERADNILRLMLHPDNEQLEQFYNAYEEAVRILSLPLSEMPEELIGYDGFLSNEASDTNFIDWYGGNKRIQLTSCGNVWNDKYKEDNRWFILQNSP